MSHNGVKPGCGIDLVRNFVFDFAALLKIIYKCTKQGAGAQLTPDLQSQSSEIPIPFLYQCVIRIFEVWECRLMKLIIIYPQGRKPPALSENVINDHQCRLRYSIVIISALRGKWLAWMSTAGPAALYFRQGLQSRHQDIWSQPSFITWGVNCRLIYRMLCALRWVNQSFTKLYLLMLPDLHILLYSI